MISVAIELECWIQYGNIEGVLCEDICCSWAMMLDFGALSLGAWDVWQWRYITTWKDHCTIRPI